MRDLVSKYKVEGWHEDSVIKVPTTQPAELSLIPWTHGRKNKLPQLIYTYTHILKKLNKKIDVNFKSNKMEHD